MPYNISWSQPQTSSRGSAWGRGRQWNRGSERPRGLDRGRNRERNREAQRDVEQDGQRGRSCRQDRQRDRDRGYSSCSSNATQTSYRDRSRSGGTSEYRGIHLILTHLLKIEPNILIYATIKTMLLPEHQKFQKLKAMLLKKTWPWRLENRTTKNVVKKTRL